MSLSSLAVPIQPENRETKKITRGCWISDSIVAGLHGDGMRKRPLLHTLVEGLVPDVVIDSKLNTNPNRNLR